MGGAQRRTGLRPVRWKSLSGRQPGGGAYVNAHLADLLGSKTRGAIAHDVIYGKNEQRLAFDLVGQPIRLDYAVDLS